MLKRREIKYFHPANIPFGATTPTPHKAECTPTWRPTVGNSIFNIEYKAENVPTEKLQGGPKGQHCCDFTPVVC